MGHSMHDLPNQTVEKKLGYIVRHRKIYNIDHTWAQSGVRGIELGYS